jgi:DNA invertase Pin-like site-specific DNA recombinase
MIALQVREVGSGAAKRAREKLLEAARRRETDVVLVWRLDRWGRSVTDLLATLQELNHLGVGFVSLTEALDLTTPAGRAMAGLVAIFAEFEREVLRERTRAGLAHARENGKRLGRPETAARHAAEIRKLRRAGISKSEIARRLQIGRTSGASHSGSKIMRRPKRDAVREDRIHNEAIVDARPEEQAMSWYYYLESKISFPFRARCVAANAVSPLRKGETTDLLRMATEDACEHDMLVQIRWQGRKMSVPLSQLEAIDADEPTQEAIGDWHYWVAQGCIL